MTAPGTFPVRAAFDLTEEGASEARPGRDSFATGGMPQDLPPVMGFAVDLAAATLFLIAPTVGTDS